MAEHRTADMVELRLRVRAFAEERDWQQFHTPKNLSMALAVEVGELLELFQWLTSEESAVIMASDRAPAVAAELADVLIYLVRLADVLEVDLVDAAAEKLETNAQNYPVDVSRGTAIRPPRS